MNYATHWNMPNDFFLWMLVSLHPMPLYPLIFVFLDQAVVIYLYFIFVLFFKLRQVTNISFELYTSCACILLFIYFFFCLNYVI